MAMEKATAMVMATETKSELWDFWIYSKERCH